MDINTLQKHEYALEKLSSAIRMLAVGAGDVRSRLVEASTSFCLLTDDLFPDQLRSEFNWIMTKLATHEPTYINGDLYKGSIEASMSRIHNKTGVKIAKRLVSLRDRLEYFLSKQNCK